jgi:hypothetical protein
VRGRDVLKLSLVKMLSVAIPTKSYTTLEVIKTKPRPKLLLGLEGEW